MDCCPGLGARATSRGERSDRAGSPLWGRDTALFPSDELPAETLWRPVGCINSIGHGLGGDVVLVDEAAEPVVSADRGRWRACPGPRRISGFWGCEFERPVRSMGVVVLDELPQNML